jgi:hypothetical protein
VSKIILKDKLGIVLPWEADLTPRDLEAEYAALRIPRKRWCPHTRTRLDTDSRRVFCRACGDEVDAFTVLEGIAREGERLLVDRDHLRNQIAALEDHVEELQRMRRSLKGQIKRRSR